MISMTWWLLNDMLNANLKKHVLMIAFLNCKKCVKKLMRLKWKRILYPFKDFTIQMSLFLYWLNMSTIIRISYPEKSSRVQSRSWHVWLIKLDIVVLILKSMKTYILASLMTLVKLVWIHIKNLCHLLCQIPWYFGLKCYMSCMQSIFFIHTYSLNKSPCFSPINWDCIKWLILIMQISRMLLSLFALSDPIGDYSFVYIMTKRGSRLW